MQSTTAEKCRPLQTFPAVVVAVLYALAGKFLDAKRVRALKPMRIKLPGPGQAEERPMLPALVVRVLYKAYSPTGECDDLTDAKALDLEARSPHAAAC